MNIITWCELRTEVNTRDIQTIRQSEWKAYVNAATNAIHDFNRAYTEGKSDFIYITDLGMPVMQLKCIISDAFRLLDQAEVDWSMDFRASALQKVELAITTVHEAWKHGNRGLIIH